MTKGCFIHYTKLNMSKNFYPSSLKFITSFIKILTWSNFEPPTQKPIVKVLSQQEFSSILSNRWTNHFWTNGHRFNCWKRKFHENQVQLGMKQKKTNFNENQNEWNLKSGKCGRRNLNLFTNSPPKANNKKSLQFIFTLPLKN